MHTTSLSTTTVSDHRAGPPGCGNGGWVCGLLVERLDDLVPTEGSAVSATVRLTAPTPVNRPLRWEVDGDVTDPDELAVHLLHEETLLGTAHRSEGPSGLAIPAPVTLEEARTAAAAFDPTGHPFTGCYVCGPDAPDGLHVYASPVDSRPGLLASPVTLDEGGLPPVLAALDCPGAFACGIDEDPLLLGTFVTTVHQEVPRDRELVVLAWSTGREGRKRWSGTALYDGERLLASAAATWIAVSRDLIPGTAPAA